MWWFFTHDREEKDRAKFRMRLWVPPADQRGKEITQGPWSAEKEMEAFSAFQAQTGTGPAALPAKTL